LEKYQPVEERYDKMKYNRCGRSGLLLPSVSLGLWHNFGFVDNYDNAREIILQAFDSGITHFDLANNYGPPFGSAETNFGKILQNDLKPYRDELIISTKAGYLMWPGPYGNWGSRKYLVASLDQSLHRMGLDYVDIFYSHRPDPNTPMEETMSALHQAVVSGKAIYPGISNYDPDQTRQACRILRELGSPCVIHQPKYSMLVRDIESGLLDVLADEGIGCIPFSPLAQGLLTNKYLDGVPDNSRAGKAHGFLKRSSITSELVRILKSLNEIANQRGQSLAQMALSWVLRDQQVTSVLIGVSSPAQLENSLSCLDNTDFSGEELEMIDQLLAETDS
jgi:L-glyceraldehyde 3-phosphate reductase